MRPMTGTGKGKRGVYWNLLLLLPAFGLLFPGLYPRSTPTLFGFPFFYWYQFAWVFVTAGLTLLVYRLAKD